MGRRAGPSPSISGPPKRAVPAPPARAEGHRFTTISLELFQPISLDGEVIRGPFSLSPISGEIRASLWRFVIVLIVLLVVCSFVALLVVARLQRIISDPLPISPAPPPGWPTNATIPCAPSRKVTMNSAN